MLRREIAGINDGTPEAYRYKTVEERIATDPMWQAEEDTRTEGQREADDERESAEFLSSMLTELPVDLNHGKVSIDRGLRL